MNKKLQNLVEPNTRLFMIFLILFAGASAFFEVRVAIAEGAVTLALIVYSIVIARKKRRALVEYIESVTYDAESAKNNTLLNFPLPMVVFRLDSEQVVWGNQMFFNICGKTSPFFNASVSDMVPGFTGKWILEGKTRYPGLVQLGERKYEIHGNMIKNSADDAGPGYMGITYWVDVTDFDDIKQEYSNSRPVAMYIVLDNYDEMTKGVSDRVKAELRSQIEDRLIQWAESTGGFLRRVDWDRYVFIFEYRHLAVFKEEKFKVLEAVHEIVNPSGIHATVSLGLGVDGGSYEEDFDLASLSIEMALSRGGDQAVVRDRFNFEFFGGRGSEVETRTKVKSRVVANALLELMKSASQTYVMGHKFADLDSIGGAVGVCCVARKCGKSAKIVVDPDKNASKVLIDQLKKQTEYSDAFITPEEAILGMDSRSLLVVVDTNRPEQTEDQRLITACSRVAVIDHHRRAATYIENATLTFHEPFASSVCELMTELLQELVGQSDILRFEAEAMMAGIVLDTKNFTIRTGERTFDAAAFLRRAGADTTEVKKMLQTDFDQTVARYGILEKARLYRDDLAVSVMDGPQDRIVAAQAADEMLNISGVESSFVLYPTEAGGVIMSARSIGSVNVQVILEKLGGGGNKSAAGVQMENVTVREAVNRLFAAIDDYFS